MVAGPRNHLVIHKAGIQDSGLFSCDRWRNICCLATSHKAGFWPAITSRLPVIWELSSGCFEVKSAPQFSRSGYHDLDAQKIQALAVKKPCQRSASLLLCDRKL